MKRLTPWLDNYQRRHPWAGFPLAVVYKFFDDQGTYLAALITYYGFLSLFPLLLLLASVLGFVLQASPELQADILDSALRQLPVIGEELGDPRGLPGNGLAVAVGAAVAVYGALGVAQALQHAMNVAWAVPRHRRPNPLRARLRSLALIGAGSLAVLATTLLSALGAVAGSSGSQLDRVLGLLAGGVAVALDTLVFALVFRIATARRLGWRQVAPGALVAAAAWQLLQVFGRAYAGRVSEASSATYGAFAVVLGLLAWLFLAANVVVACVELNVVRAKHLYPRALLTPFTDDVELTGADEHTYADAATAQQAKGFEVIDVRFDGPGGTRGRRRLGIRRPGRTGAGPVGR